MFLKFSRPLCLGVCLTIFLLIMSHLKVYAQSESVYHYNLRTLARDRITNEFHIIAVGSVGISSIDSVTNITISLTDYQLTPPTNLRMARKINDGSVTLQSSETDYEILDSSQNFMSLLQISNIFIPVILVQESAGQVNTTAWRWDLSRSDRSVVRTKAECAVMKNDISGSWHLFNDARITVWRETENVIEIWDISRVEKQLLDRMLLELTESELPFDEHWFKIFAEDKYEAFEITKVRLSRQ